MSIVTKIVEKVTQTTEMEIIEYDTGKLIKKIMMPNSLTKDYDNSNPDICGSKMLDYISQYVKVKDGTRFYHTTDKLIFIDT